MLKPLLLFSLSVLLGGLIWFLSPIVAGHKEAWDGHPGYYLCTLFAAGFIPACFSARWFWLCAVGAWLGQVIAFVFLFVRSDAALWPLGLLLLCFYSLLSLVGAALGAGVHLLLRRLFSHRTKVA